MKSSQPTCMFRRILLGRAAPRRSRLPKCRPRLPSSRTYATATVSAADLKFGQPLNETHPHLIRAGEITPGISAQEYANRRSKLAAKLPRGAIAIIAASDIKYRSGAAFYDFHQASNFFYFTGFNEPDAVAIIEKTGDLEEHVFHLFLRPKDPRAELWDGARSGIQAALDVFNADEAQDISDLRTALPSIVSKADEVFIDLPPAAMPKSTFASLFSTPSPRLQGVAALLEKCKQKPFQAIANELRVLKSDAEISNMRHAGKVSGRAFTDAMRQKFALEKDLAAYLDYHFKIGGCDASAYVPVVAGGENALSIHYVRNDDVLKNDQLVLVDAGGEYGGYITDITRTWPIGGKFSDAQRDLYQAILNVQRSCVSLCREDARMSLDKLHGIAENGLKEQLRQIGFDMSGDAIETLFPHHVGHHIGLDIHDSPGFSRKDDLRTNHCITIEPGIYVPDDDRWPEHFRGIAIRIEDSICIQEETPLVLTTEAVKEVVDIESLRES